MNPSMAAEQGTSDSAGLFTAFREERIPTRRWLYFAVAPLVPIVAAVMAWVSMLGSEQSMQIVTAHGIRVVSPGMSREEVVGKLGRPIGKEARADGADCFLHGMFSMNEPQTTIYVLCYVSDELRDMSTRRYSLWAADPNGQFTPAGVPTGDSAAPAPAPKP